VRLLGRRHPLADEVLGVDLDPAVELRHLSGTEAPELNVAQPAEGESSVLLVALQVDMIFLGLLRPLWGAVSDRYGRPQTLFASFALQTILATLFWLALTRLPPELAAPVLAWATGPTFAG